MEEDRICKALEWSAKISFIIAGIMIAMMMLCSCSTHPKVEYLTKENTVAIHDTLFREKIEIRIDSVVVFKTQSISRRDSIAPIVDSLNRVIGFERWHFERVVESSEAERKRYENALDSLRAVKTEKVVTREPYPVEVEKEVNRLHWWQKILMWIGGVCIMAIIVFAGILFRHR